MTALKRILVIANKAFEADPLVHVLASERGSPREADLGPITFGSYPRLRKKDQRRNQHVPPATTPLLTLTVPRAAAPFAQVEVWCVEDLMDPTRSSSNTLEKWRVLDSLRQTGGAPDLVVAVGTGATDGQRLNGSVIIGSRVFIHDPYAGAADRTGMWTPPVADQVIAAGALPSKLFRELDEDARYPAEGRFLHPPIEPSPLPRIIAGHPFVSIGVVNVNDRYDHYAWADPAALASFNQVTGGRERVGSLETTHGVIRSAFMDSPFLYVTGVTNAMRQFDLETTPRVYGQNLAVAHNAGVAVAWLIPQLVETLLIS
jgi:hypothetical protein